MEKKIENIDSKLISMDELILSRNFYNIPRYQRLFVWENEQVETLLQDLYEAYKAHKELYYLGGILIVEQKGEVNIYDLIDGQQRFTTLWLLSLELGGSLAGFTKVDNKLRLKFSIRKEATQYFESALNPNNEVVEISKENSSLVKINTTRSRIKAFVDQKFISSSEKKDFTDFIKDSVKLIVTEVPQDTDLNKLFEVINNRGQQLMHHEILKATILSNIDNKQERVRYGKIWNACADMDNYIERNIQFEVGRNLSGTYNHYTQTFDLKNIFEVMKEKRSKVNRSITLNSILDGKVIESEDDEEINTPFEEETPEAKDDELQPVRSILTFPQLLLHTLRIYLHQHGKKDINRINEKELLFTFKAFADISSEKESRAFIELLWEVRTCFDLFIIKWVKIDSNVEVHMIKKLDKYNQYRKWTYYFRRRKPENNENEGFALLQSMLYHSQQIITHYWLTPLLYKSLKDRNRENLYNYLRKLDNVLFCSSKTDTLPERTWSVMNKELSDHRTEYNADELDKDSGVAFPHYWFYKLEFVLWYLLKDKKGIPWKNFNMTAKNSVEHISPQTPVYVEDTVSDAQINKFGNLALVSRSINSEFSNKPFREKRERFLYNNVNDIDSLKLSLVYANSTWDDEICEMHQNEMKQYMIDYIRNN
jgi:hypothetical protein